MDKSAVDSSRLMSIDALRGFDMFMIIFADRFFWNFNAASKTAFSKALAEQFEHPEWLGSHFYDIIMPLFLFLVGVVIPFSLSKRTSTSNEKSKLYPHLIKRFFILFALGWIVQGNLLLMDSSKFQFFSNTLQAIAVGYLFSCMAYIHLSKKGRYLFFALCLIIYTLILNITFVPGMGHFELLPDKNIAIYIDKLVFGRFYDGTQYSWLITGLGFIATTLSGIFAGEMLLSNMPRKKVALNLVLIGLLGIVLGLVLGIWHPIIKKIWTSTFVLLSSGICFLLLALFYWIIDVKGYKRWAFPLRIIGINAIAAYVGAHVFDFSQIAKQILHGFEQFFLEYYNSFADIGGFAILYLILWYMNKNKTYIKI